MTEHEKRIREALEAGVTGANENHDTIWMKVGSGAVMLNSGRPVWARIADCAHEPNAAFIAACNPAAIRALLADLDAVRGKAARYDYLRDAHWSDAELCCVVDPKANVRLGAMCPSGENLDCLIDAALKGATA